MVEHRPFKPLAVGSNPTRLTVDAVKKTVLPGLSPSSRGLGRGPFKAKTRVRIPLGAPTTKARPRVKRGRAFGCSGTGYESSLRRRGGR
jgi:hypothetical protein